MTYNIKVTHTAPTFKQFEEWGIEKVYPTFYTLVHLKCRFKKIDLKILYL